jgi:tetratricopeptide (TPR) repeat protein
MITLALAVQLAMAAAGSPCAPTEPGGDDATDAPARDAEAAAAYRAVGDEARHSGDVSAARVAYQQALRRDTNDAEARAALQVLCREEPPASSPARDAADEARFEEATRLMQNGDRVGAIAAFERLRASAPDGSTALLEGICELQLGHEGRARQLLEEARAEPSVNAAASFFLGLIALDEGRRDDASTLLSAATRDSGPVGENAADLLATSRRDGRIVVSALTEVGYDSNVQLLPDGTSTGGTGDGFATALAGLFVRPMGTSGPYARLTAQYRRQITIGAYDLGDLSAALGVRTGRGGRYASVEYGYDFLTLGGASYLSAHRLLGAARWKSGHLSLSAAYAARFESFLTSTTAGYSGLRHDADGELGWQLGHLTEVAIGYHAGSDGVRLAPLGYFEHGPLALGRIALGRSARVLAETRLTFRNYDGTDPDFGIQRADRYLDGAITIEADISSHWTLRAGGTARRAKSNVADLTYSKVTAALGLVYATGAL